MTSCSEDESSSSESDSSDDESDDDSPIPQVNNVKAEDSEDDDYEDDDYEDDTAPAVNIEYKAPVVGRTSEHKPPRFDVSRLRPFEVMFADEKEYDMPQRGGWTTSFILLDLASDAWFKVDATRKTSHPDSLQQIVIQNGIHLLTYPRTLYTDGCGSMKLVRDKSIVLGINHVFIPPYTQSLNEAERIADRAFAAGRTHLASTNALPTHMALAVDMVCYMKLRMATTASRSWLTAMTPYEIIKGYAPTCSISHCVSFFTRAFATVPKDKRAKLKKKGQGHLRAEEGRLVGYRDLWTDTPKILLSENRMIHSRNL